LPSLPPAQALGKLEVWDSRPRAHRTEEVFVIVSRMTRLLVAVLVAGVFAMVGITSQPTAAASTRQLALGVSALPWDSLDSVDSFASSVGRRPATWTIWNDWGGPGSGFPDMDLMNGLYARHITPLVFWQPTDPTTTHLAKYAYINIRDGDFDKYIKRWARAAKSYGHTILLRFAHEMDGDWFPWSISKYGNNATRFVKAWRHVWGIFHKVGATNVRFVWSPLNPCYCRHNLYPGDKYVAYVGFTALNWGTTKGEWRSMRAIVSERMKKIHLLTHRPVIVAELASSDAGGSKATWITKGYADVYQHYPQIRALVYFNVNMSTFTNQPDWRLEASTSAVQAYANLVSQKHFRGRIR
jgi:hypothetical protein